MRRRYLSVLALAVLGVAAIVLSFILTPTPDTFARLDGHRVRVAADMHAVDYAILVLRVGGVVAFLTGSYLTYRRWRPDRVEESESGQSHWHDPYENIPPEGGNPSSRAGVNFNL